MKSNPDGTWPISQPLPNSKLPVQPGSPNPKDSVATRVFVTAVIKSYFESKDHSGLMGSIEVEMPNHALARVELDLVRADLSSLWVNRSTLIGMPIEIEVVNGSTCKFSKFMSSNLQMSAMRTRTGSDDPKTGPKTVLQELEPFLNVETPEDVLKKTDREKLGTFIADVLKNRLNSSQTLALMRARGMTMENLMLARVVLTHYEQD